MTPTGQALPQKQIVALLVGADNPEAQSARYVELVTQLNRVLDFATVLKQETETLYELAGDDPLHSLSKLVADLDQGLDILFGDRLQEIEDYIRSLDGAEEDPF